MPRQGESKLLAISDLHVGYAENRAIVQELKPATPGDWLLVAGDVGERLADIAWALGLLAGRFERVVWVPGNHELWSPPDESPDLRGTARYEHLVGMCRDLGVLTPEDDYPVWEGAGGPVRIVPLFLLYDYTFRPAGHHTKESALAYAHSTGVVCTDEYLLHPDPYPSREAWCQARVELTERRLAGLDNVPLVFVNHYPLVREPTDILHYPQFAQWCGTTATREWHTRHPTAAVIYGHLHIPRVTWYDGVRFEEVSLGYPREWRRRPGGPMLLRDVLVEEGRQ
ncbi:metallophosphoesterase [Nonomuraea sp. B19D2]|uniref:metallophosphoesterase family protein n=1 Tax=Nonomuraea sp. B19D2 TaxID=3159561 RepID=UPI0032DAC08C